MRADNWCGDCGARVARRAELAHYCRRCAAIRRHQDRDGAGLSVCMSFAEIAAELGITQSRVRLVYNNAVSKLRRMHGRALRSVLDAMKDQEPVELGGRQMPRGHS